MLLGCSVYVVVCSLFGGGIGMCYLVIDIGVWFVIYDDDVVYDFGLLMVVILVLWLVLVILLFGLELSRVNVLVVCDIVVFGL